MTGRAAGQRVVQARNLVPIRVIRG